MQGRNEIKHLLMKKIEYQTTYFFRLTDRRMAYQRARYKNTSSDAGIMALSILLQHNYFDKKVFIFLDFKDEAIAHIFFPTFPDGCHFKKSSLGALEENEYTSFKAKPISYVLSYDFSEYGCAPELQSAAKDRLSAIIIAIQHFDPLDKMTLEHIKENFFLKLNDPVTAQFAKYKKDYFQGSMMKFFQAIHLHTDLAPTMVDLLSDKDNRNIASLNKATDETGFNNMVMNF